MNGIDVPDYGGRNVYENAQRMAQGVIERAIRHEHLSYLEPATQEVAERKVFAVRALLHVEATNANDAATKVEQLCDDGPMTISTPDGVKLELLYMNGPMDWKGEDGGPGQDIFHAYTLNADGSVE